MKIAIYNKQVNQLEYWSSKNTTTFCYAGSLKHARNLIKVLSPIEQKVVPYKLGLRITDPIADEIAQILLKNLNRNTAALS